MTKHVSSFFKAALMSVALVGLGATAQAEVTLTHGEAGPNRGARAKALQWFADQVTERSAGDIKIDIQWGGALFKANAAATSIADGVSDLGTVIAVYFPKEMITYTIADLPLGNADAWVGMRATDDLMRNNASIKANLADKGLVYIGSFTTSAVNIGCTEGNAIRTAEDIAGKKVRGVGAYGKTFGDLGATLVPMSIYKAYQGIDSGLLDCSQGYSYAVAALKQHEVIKNYTLLNWGQVGGLGILMNKDIFDSLTAEQQTTLLETGKDMSDYFGEIIGAANAKAIETMKAAGVEVIELPADERAKLVAAGDKYIADWVGKADAAGLDGAAILADYKALLEKYAAERDAQGYPWTR